MTNLTIALDEDIIKRARIRAIGEGTSVSAQLRDYLVRYANKTDAETAEREQRQAAAASFKALAKRAPKRAAKPVRPPKAGAVDTSSGSRDAVHERASLARWTGGSA